MTYKVARDMGSALAETVDHKLTAEVIEFVLTEVASGRAPTVLVRALRVWGPPLEFFMSVVVAMDTDSRPPDCDVSALKVELAKAMLADAEFTGAPN